MISYLLLLLGFWTSPQQTIKGVRLTQIFPQIGNDWQVQKYDTASVSLFFFEDRVLYEFPTFQNNYVEYSLVSSFKQESYIGFFKGDTVAVKFSTRFQKNDETVLKDSALKNHWAFSVNIDNFFSKLYNIVLLENLQKDTEREEKYYINMKSDTSNSCILSLKYTSEIKFSEYSFAKSLDSISDKKLVDVKLTTFPKYFPDAKKTMSGITISYHLEKIESPDQEKLMPYFNKLFVKKKQAQ